MAEKQRDELADALAALAAGEHVDTDESHGGEVVDDHVHLDGIHEPVPHEPPPIQKAAAPPPPPPKAKAPAPAKPLAPKTSAPPAVVAPEKPVVVKSAPPAAAPPKPVAPAPPKPIAPAPAKPIMTPQKPPAPAVPKPIAPGQARPAAPTSPTIARMPPPAVPQPRPATPGGVPSPAIRPTIAAAPSPQRRQRPSAPGQPVETRPTPPLPTAPAPPARAVPAPPVREEIVEDQPAPEVEADEAPVEQAASPTSAESDQDMVVTNEQAADENQVDEDDMMLAPAVDNEQLAKRRVTPVRKKRVPAYQTLNFKRTAIPIFLTLGVIFPLVAILTLVMDDTTAIGALGKVLYFPITLLVVGVLMALFGILNMLQVKRELAAAADESNLATSSDSQTQ